MLLLYTLLLPKDSIQKIGSTGEEYGSERTDRR